MGWAPTCNWTAAMTAEREEGDGEQMAANGGGGRGGYSGEVDEGRGDKLEDDDLPVPSVPSFPPNMLLPTPSPLAGYRPPPPPLPEELAVGTKLTLGDPTITLGFNTNVVHVAQFPSLDAQPVQAEPSHLINSVHSSAVSHQVAVPTAVHFVNGRWAKHLCSCSCGLCVCCAVTFCFCITIGQLWERVMKAPGACKTISIGLWSLCVVIFICGSISDGGVGEVYEIFSTLTGAANFALLITVTILVCYIRERSRREYKIAPHCCGDCEDCCCALCCNVCTQCQIFYQEGFPHSKSYLLYQPTGEDQGSLTV